MEGLELLSVVALTKDLPERRLRRGQVGTIVENLLLKDSDRHSIYKGFRIHGLNFL